MIFDSPSFSLFYASLVVASVSVVLSSMDKMTANKEESIYENLSISCNKFSNDFYKIISSMENNIASSPLSLHIILSMLTHGAKGVTLEELKQGLHLDDVYSLHDGFKSVITSLNDVNEVELSLSNRVYIQDGFDLTTEFLTSSKDIFHCSIATIDFKNSKDAVNQINLWIEKETKNKISDIASTDDISEDTKMVLLNAVYFKGSWLHKFDEKLTENKPFHVTETEKKLVPMMFKKSKYIYGEIPNLHASFIEIPYLDKDIAMIIILPNEIQGLQFMEKNFDWYDVINVPRNYKELELYLPRFKFDFTIDLENILRKIGFNKMFENDANFNGLSRIPLKVGKVLQKVFIEVNEEGTEAAAATVAQIRLRRMINTPEQFLVNHPFMFAIQHKPSTTLLFLGRVSDIQTSVEKDEL